MANPRQRAKARSGRSTKPSLNQKRRIHQKLRRAPPLRGPEVLQQGWDKKKTVFQNYTALGLLPSIPLPTSASSSRSHRAPLDLPTNPEVSYGRIIRDDEGNVIDIILDGEEELAAPEGEGTEASGGRGNGSGGAQAQGRRKDEALNPEKEYEPEVVVAKTDLVRSLESLSSTSQPVKRHSSTSEKEWLRQLVAAHGDDYDAMSRNKKLNVWQKTPGEIGRMIRKAGGVQKLASQAPPA